MELDSYSKPEAVLMPNKEPIARPVVGLRKPGSVCFSTLEGTAELCFGQATVHSNCSCQSQPGLRLPALESD